MSLSRTARRIRLPALLAALLAAALLAIAPGSATPARASAGVTAAGGGAPGQARDRARARRLGGCLELEQRHPPAAASGFTVYAPPNPLRGLPQDSAYLHQFLTQNAALRGHPIVLVGHSYGGAVITNAAVGVPAVRALVYVDAFIPDQGDTIGHLAAARPGSCLGNPAQDFNPVPYPGAPSGDVDLYIKPSLVPGCFATGLPASAGRGHRGHPAAAHGQRVRRAVRAPGLEDHPVLGRDRDRGPGHPARGADAHGQARGRPHHRRQRRAPVPHLRAVGGDPRHPPGRFHSY